MTWLCHLWLGAVDGLAPIGAWVAITNHLPWQAWVLGAAVACWVAGFDFFYALFDVEVDREEGLHSIVDAVRRARRIRRRAHRAPRDGRAASSSRASGSRSAFSTGSASPSVAALLVYEHTLVRPDDLRRLDAAFFTMNGVISVVFAVFVIADTIA